MVAIPCGSASTRPFSAREGQAPTLALLHLLETSEDQLIESLTHDVIIGKGFLDVEGMFQALEEVRFPADGAMSLEFEGNPKDPVGEIKQCIAVAAKAARKVAGS